MFVCVFLVLFFYIYVNKTVNPWVTNLEFSQQFIVYHLIQINLCSAADRIGHKHTRKNFLTDQRFVHLNIVQHRCHFHIPRKDRTFWLENERLNKKPLTTEFEVHFYRRSLHERSAKRPQSHGSSCTIYYI